MLPPSLWKDNTRHTILPKVVIMTTWRPKHSLLALWIVVGHLIACTQLMHPVTSHSSYNSKSVATLTGIPRVYDGDSISLGAVEVRLEAIDAPELYQACKDKSGQLWTCGIEARQALQDMIGSSEVHCVITGKDKYRRFLGTCFVHGDDMNETMVKKGYAIAYHTFSERYALQEQYAKIAQRGIWQDTTFTEPYYCRHPHKEHTCYRML